MWSLPPHLHLLVEHLEGLLHIAEGNKHVLDEVVSLVQLLHSLTLRQLQERHLRGHQPAQEVAEHHVVAEGDDVLWGARGGGRVSCVGGKVEDGLDVEKNVELRI